MNVNLPEAYLPKGAPLSVLRQRGWLTLDRRGGVREGCLSLARGIDPRALPSLSTVPMPKRTAHTAIAGRPLSLDEIDGDLYITAEQDGEVTLYRTRGGAWHSVSLGTQYPAHPRTVLPFTRYNSPSNPLDTRYNFPMVLILPDAVFLRNDKEDMNLYPMCERTDGEAPYLSHACVYLSRLFGVGEDRAYASDYNSITQWLYDTADSISASHAWVTTSQSNLGNAGNFTAIVPFAGQLLAFKENCCQLIGGTKNPFRISDLLSVGAISARAVAQVGSQLLFASRDQVYRYDGDNLHEIGDPLHIEDFTGALAAASGGLFYLYVPSVHRIFTYSPITDAWCELFPFAEGKIACMTGTREGCLFLTESGELYSTKDATDSLVPALPAPSRLLRLRLTLTAAAGAHLLVGCRFSGGRLLPLLELIGTGRTQRESIRIPAAADTASTLCFSGQGSITVTAMELVTAETATDGT